LLTHNYGLAIREGGVVLNNGAIDLTTTIDTFAPDDKGVIKNRIVGIWGSLSKQPVFAAPDPGETPVDWQCALYNIGKINLNVNTGEFSADQDRDVVAGPSGQLDMQTTAYGIHGGEHSESFNMGELSVDVDGGKYVGNPKYITYVNSSVEAYGMYAEQDADVYNTGSIRISAKGASESMTAVSGGRIPGTIPLGLGDTMAAGLYNVGGGLVRNDGNISVTSTGSEVRGCTGSFAAGIVAGDGSRIVQNGDINVSAESTDRAVAYGIFSNGNAELYSTGNISVQAHSDAGNEQAFQVYANQGTLKIKEYSVFLEQDTDAFCNIWGHGAKGGFDFSDSVLEVRADMNSLFDTPFSVDKFVTGETHTFSKITGVLPDDIDMTVIGKNEAVQLSYNPKQDVALESTQSSRLLVNKVSDISDQALVNAAVHVGNFFSPQQPQQPAELAYSPISVVPGETAGILYNHSKISSSSAFLLPYVVSSEDQGSTSAAAGAVGGQNFSIDSDNVVGFHLGYGKGRIDYGAAEKIAENILSAGGQFYHRFSGSWALRGTTSFFHSQNEYTNSKPLNEETASYEGYGALTMLTGSYEMPITENFLLEPELSFRHEWIHQNQYTTDNLSGLDTTYGTVDDHEVYGTASLRWIGRYILTDSVTVLPSFRVFGDQVLTDGSTRGSMELLGQRATMTHNNDDPSWGGQCVCTFRREQTSLELGYTCQCQSAKTQQSGWFMAQYLF
jgi:hypothetical protein